MYVLSLRKCNGTFKCSREHQFSYENRQPSECRNFLSFDEFNKPDAYLEHDIFTLRCQVWKEGASVSKPSVNCLAQTKITTAQLNYLWVLEDLVDSDFIPKSKFKRSTDPLIFDSEFPTIRIHLSSAETFDNDAIYFAIERADYSRIELFAVYKIYLLDSNGRTGHSICGEVFLPNNGDIQKFPFLSKRKLLSNKELYFSGGKLAVQYLFSISGNLEVEKVEYETDAEIKFNPVQPIINSVSELSDGQELWKENMRQFYSDGEFSDLLVRTPNEEFPVHRAILCAQSEVFRGMMSHDMKEKNSGVIEINDFEDDTVSEMLSYLYTNALDGDIDYALAKDLYFAADKYRITPLQKMCSKRLMDSMELSNVCDIMLLADQLRDIELKSTARDLIVSRFHEIMYTEHWKRLMETNSQLTSETMQWMIFNHREGARI
ncbi:hypothetical protein JTE90_028867 [Oedothorax gibbosus]|uniref:BTB domain-containing protein n=1 Tax=Oedothorax gibbosus TaxID=931172 RepID=A0AAV6U8C4_9ARAC|nr:hypothetical protein JTE90_028867 [Oedothorax gibbosus]